MRLLSGCIGRSRSGFEDTRETTSGFRFGTLVSITAGSPGCKHGETPRSYRTQENRTKKSLGDLKAEDGGYHRSIAERSRGATAEVCRVGEQVTCS